ncbi:MAG: aromatic ring-hydroxylating dioxygenase subunit alpha [Actinomycetota bacterium]|nr:aromatic ring-hydroxylating dioxygenase subunit alpha [Actinomycetota bacterium]
MERNEQVSQIKMLLSRLDSGTNVDAGGVRLNPTSSYTDPIVANSERDLFFRGHPQLLGLSGDLPEAGSFFTANDLDTRILATRDDDGQFRAFVNACRHRGVAVEEQESGNKRRFACPFHGWSYDSRGALVGVPKEDHFGEIDKDSFGLIELSAQEKYGFLFANPDPSGTVDIDELLGAELSKEFEAWNFGSYSRLGGDRYDVDCNWKLAMDTFGETYHFNYLHRDSLATFFQGNVQCYDTYGRHHRMILCKKAIHEMREWSEDRWDITVAGLPVYWIFPNSIVMPSDFGLYVVRAYPDEETPSRHTSVISFYVRGDRIGTARSNTVAPERQALLDTAPLEVLSEVAEGFAAIIRDEDYVASASQQRSANSGAVEHVMFGRNEPALHHYHNTYRAALGQEPLPLI